MSFWDSSAILPLCINEQTSGSVIELAQRSGGIVVWWATIVEVQSACSRKTRMGELSSDERSKGEILLLQLSLVWAELPPSETIRSRARRLLSAHPLRAADALQLAAALEWSESSPIGKSFVCLDKRLREAAALEGFQVAP